MRNPSALLIAALILLCLPPSVRADSPHWRASVPAAGKESAPWVPFLSHLLERGMNYGAASAASRMLLLFTELTVKETAYQALIQVVDRGYPFSVQPVFLPGDIQPQEGYDFINSYNLYKAILNEQNGTQKWAKAFLANVDQEGFPKYLFYQALDAYSKNDLTKAEELLKKILAKDAGEIERLPFIRKVARTLARLYFEREEYAKSLDIYNSFLLKLNPITPSNWVEAAWALYHLKRYPEALGMLYNLESKTTDGTINLEKYTIRALIYREICAITHAESLIQSFETDFGPFIQGIKRGESLSKFPVLAQIDIPENAKYHEIASTLIELRRESEHIKDLPRADQSLANYLYVTEVKMLSQRGRGYSEKAQDNAASALVLLSEQLRFLKYDVAREKFNPDMVFKPTETKSHALVENFGTTYQLRWNQFGDYWSDEREVYQGMVPNRCGE
jgi:tetratricopeptide (TPR) repeat protein